MAMEREEKTFLRAMAYVLIAFVLMVWALWLLSPKQAAQAVAPGSAAERRGAPATAAARVAIEPDSAPSQAVEGPADPIIVRTMAQLPLVENGFEVVGPTSRKPSNPAPGQRYLDTDLNTYSIYNGTSWLSVNTSAGIGLIDDIGDVGIDDAQIGDFLGWDGSRWTDLTVGIADLDDVDLTGIGDNQYLSYASATHKWVPVSLSTDDLSNFNLTSLADNQFIRYDSGTNKLVNETVDVPADAGYFVVTEYGAIADDGLDDRTGINACIDAAEAFTLAGVATKQRAVVVFPRGVYHMTTPGGIPLQITGDRITVEANGATLTKLAAGAENQLLYIADTAEDVIVNGLTVDGNYPTWTSSGESLGINVGGTRCELHECTVRRTAGSAIVDQIGANWTKIVDCKTFDTGRHAVRSRGNNCHILGLYAENWNIVDPSGGGPAILADSVECDADELHIERAVLRMTTAKQSAEAILIDPGDGDLDDGTDDLFDAGNSGAATQQYAAGGGWFHTSLLGKAAWTIDAGHGFMPGDAITIDGSGKTEYDGATSLGMCHKILKVTGRVFVRAVSATTLSLHPTAEDAQANSNAYDLTTAGTGIWYIKAAGSSVRTVDSSTGVDTGTNVITTDVAHEFRTGTEARLTLDHKTNSALPAGLANVAVITTNTPYAATGGGTAATYIRPKRYRKVTIKEVDIYYIASTTQADAAIKIINCNDALLDRVTVSMAGDTSSVIDDTALQFGVNTRQLTLRDCIFGSGIRNNVRGWIGNLVIDRCTIGATAPQVNGIEALQCGRFAMRDSTIRFRNYGISTGGSSTDATQFRDADCKEIVLDNNVFEGVSAELASNPNTTRCFVMRCINPTAHLRHSGILKYTNNERRRADCPQHTFNGSTIGYYGLAFTVSGSPTTTFTCTNHLLETGDLVYVQASGAGFVPAGLSAGTPYFFREITRDTFSLHASETDAYTGSSAISTGGDGTAPYYLVSQKAGVGYTSDNNRDVMFRQVGSSGREFISSAVPSSTGTAYRAGDKIWKPDPVSGANSPGWICTQSGDTRNSVAPTWTAMPNMNAS